MRQSLLRLSLFKKTLPTTRVVVQKTISRQIVPINVFAITRQFRIWSVRLDFHKEKEPLSSEDDDKEEEREEMRKKTKDSALSTRTYFDSKERNKETFEVMLEIYKENNPQRRGVVEFILTASKYMDDYNVSYDLQTYKKLIQLLPEKKYVPENMWQEEFYHYPKQQDCIITLLDRMESKGVCPDQDMANILVRIFGKKSPTTRKVMRQLYWFPKFKNASPWPVPFPPINDRFALAKLAIERIVSVDPQSVVSVYETKSLSESIDDTFIVSGQSPTQKKLIENHPTSQSLFVEGAFRIWIGRACVNYFILRADPKEFKLESEDPDDVTHINNPFKFERCRELIEKPSVHEQQDGTIMAVCATGSSSRDTLLSWVRLLEKNGNSALREIPVTFSLKSPLGDVVPLDNDGPFPRPTNDPEKLVDK